MILAAFGTEWSKGIVAAPFDGLVAIRTLNRSFASHNALITALGYVLLVARQQLFLNKLHAVLLWLLVYLPACHHFR